jgi:hypothetical protein
MKLPDQLFHPERASSARSVLANATRRDRRMSNLSLPARIVATLLAAIGLFGGFATIVYCVRNEAWIPAPVGIFAVLYGFAWARVAHEGRLPGGRLRLNPWARG